MVKPWFWSPSTLPSSRAQKRGAPHTNHLSPKAMEARVKATKRTTISKKKKQPAEMGIYSGLIVDL